MHSFNKKSKRRDAAKAIKNISLRRDRYYKRLWEEKKISKVHAAMIRGGAIDFADDGMEDD